MLPPHSSDEAFFAADGETDYRPALRVIAERAGLDASAEATRFADGSLPVFRLAKRVVKLYPPSCTPAFANELAVLERLDGALPVATPSVQASGGLDAWHYLVMTQLPGRSLRACFAELSVADRLRLSARVGEIVALLHGMSTTGLAQEDWTALLAEKRARCERRHRESGLDGLWLERIGPFLDDILPELPVGAPHSLLHTEIMREHVFVDVVAGRVEVSGLLDFEPAQCGPREYELSSVGLFFSEGDAAMWDAFLDGYDLPQDRREGLARRCMGWGLLHRYANLGWWLRRLPATSPRASFDDLAQEWFGSGRVA